MYFSKTAIKILSWTSGIKWHYRVWNIIKISGDNGERAVVSKLVSEWYRPSISTRVLIEHEHHCRTPPEIAYSKSFSNIDKSDYITYTDFGADGVIHVRNGVIFLIKNCRRGYLLDYALSQVAAMLRKLLQKMVFAWLVKNYLHFMETRGSLWWSPDRPFDAVASYIEAVCISVL